MRHMFLFLFLIISFHPGFADEMILIDHSEENLGISLKIPYEWARKAFVRGKAEFIPTPTEGSFIEISLFEPDPKDFSSVDLEFFLYDLMNLSDEEQKIKEFQFHKTELSGLPAYDVSYNVEREKNFKIRMFFASVNEKIYIIRYQALEENYQEYETLFATKIVPSFKISVITQTEARYQFFESPEFGFSFYYPASWRVVRTAYSRRPMPIYSDPNSGTVSPFSSSTSSEEMRRKMRRHLQNEGAVIGSEIPVMIAPDPDSFVTVTVVGFAYRYDPADIIKGYVNGIMKQAKKLNGYEHLRDFGSQIDKNLAMEYTYRYQEEKDGKKQIYYTTHYVTYANERLYQIQFMAKDENYSKYVKEVDRLVKYFRFRSVK